MISHVINHSSNQSVSLSVSRSGDHLERFPLKWKNRISRWETKWNRLFHWKFLELPENHCTIYFITLVPCPLVKIRDFTRENGILLHVSVSNMRLDAFMGHSCSTSTSGERYCHKNTNIQGAIFVNFNVFHACMRLISVWLANM